MDHMQQVSELTDRINNVLPFSNTVYRRLSKDSPTIIIQGMLIPRDGIEFYIKCYLHPRTSILQYQLNIGHTWGGEFVCPNNILLRLLTGVDITDTLGRLGNLIVTSHPQLLNKIRGFRRQRHISIFTRFRNRLLFEVIWNTQRDKLDVYFFRKYSKSFEILQSQELVAHIGQLLIDMKELKLD